MCFEKFSPFTRMILGALLGVVLGIVFGLLFGLAIGFITNYLSEPTASLQERPFANREFTAFLGMGAGAIIGAILGAISGNKK